MEEKKVKIFNLLFISYSSFICMPASSYLMGKLLKQGYSFSSTLFFSLLMISFMALSFFAFWVYLKKRFLENLRKSKNGFLVNYVDLDDD